MKRIFLFIAIALLQLLAGQKLIAGEMIFAWNHYIGQDTAIYDITFMPDKSYFLIATNQNIQKRETESGNLVETYPYPTWFFAITPDSNRILTVPVGQKPRRLQLRSLSDFNLIREYILPEDQDTSVAKVFGGAMSQSISICTDPIRPLVYTIYHKAGEHWPIGNVDTTRVYAINYETMQKEWEYGEYTGKGISHVAVSKDGRYLAVMDNSVEPLKIISLDTRSVIRKLRFTPTQYPGYASEPWCVKFSEVNPDIIYFSGKFWAWEDDDTHSGFYIYNFVENTLDSTFGLTKEKVNNIPPGYFTLFDNDERIVSTFFRDLKIINIKYKKIEASIPFSDLSDPGSWGKKIYNSRDSVFIGHNSDWISMGKYYNNVGVGGEQEPYQQLYPNPTDNSVTVPINCVKSSYQLLNSQGKIIIDKEIISPNTNSLLLDFSPYPAGAYLLKLFCDKTVHAYKIIKKG